MSTADFPNPFRPGAGHPPPYLAGRTAEREEFGRLLGQSPILENPILTGLRGVGKTVLLESLKPDARRRGWLWAGSDLSEAASLSEDHLATRLAAGLALITSGLALPTAKKRRAGAGGSGDAPLTFEALLAIYRDTPGLPVDKFKQMLTTSWQAVAKTRPEVRGIVFAYDEAQNLANRPERDQFPLSLLIDAFRSLQRQGLPLLLALAGLPTLYPALAQARASSERMFRVLFLKRLNKRESEDAIRKPIESSDSPVRLSRRTVAGIVEMSGGYPYFIQFICREVFDAFLQRQRTGRPPAVPAREIEQKLDDDFFSGRWSKTTDRQRALLWVIAHLETDGGEFTVRAVVEKAEALLDRPFSSSHANQMLASLATQGLVFKNRHGRYSFAVPLLDRFIRRQSPPETGG